MYDLLIITIIQLKENLAMGAFSMSRRVGGRFSEQSVGNREAALNFLDFFVSFCVKTKMKNILDCRRKCLQVVGVR